VKKKTGVLPATGSENSIAVAIAAVMLGGALVVASRRRLLNK
jgi:LPXTG-motif cell wall-anchored protein